MTKLPLLVSIPHGGTQMPSEVEGRCCISRADVLEDGDAFTREIYDVAEGVRFVLKADVARAFVDLFALSGFAIAYPLLDLYGRAPEQFVFRSAGTRQVIGFAVVVTFVVPLALWALETVLSLVRPRLRTPVHSVLVAALVAAFAIQALRPLASGFLLLVLGAGIGVAVATLLLRNGDAACSDRTACDRSCGRRHDAEGGVHGTTADHREARRPLSSQVPQLHGTLGGP